jgi:CRP/FNR family cyclic AMP-dependent transcriptional regulator
MDADLQAKRPTATGRGQDRLSLLRNHPFFHELSPLELERLSACVKRRFSPKGSVVFEKGDPGSGLVGVVSRLIKISVASAGGRDIVLIRAGEIFGEIALLDGHPRTADAMTDCELIVIERREFLTFLRNQPDVTLKLLEILCARLRRTSEQVQDMTFFNLDVRLAKVLIDLSSNNEAARRTGKVAITQKKLGQIVGKSRESANKQLRAWAKRGWIRLGRGSIAVLNAAKLGEIADKDSEFDRP